VANLGTVVLPRYLCEALCHCMYRDDFACFGGGGSSVCLAGYGRQGGEPRNG
jgi:hypothetical protein